MHSSLLRLGAAAMISILPIGGPPSEDGDSDCELRPRPLFALATFARNWRIERDCRAIPKELSNSRACKGACDKGARDVRFKLARLCTILRVA